MSRSGSIRLFIVIPVYGNWGDTLDCLRALAKQTTTDFRVLLSDDASPEPAPAEVTAHSFVDYVLQPHRGFAGNCNAGAREAIARGATHLLFLNSDTDFSPRFVEAWLRAIEQRPSAILSPHIYWYDEPQSIWYSGGTLTIWAPFIRRRQEFREPTEVEMVTGCALLAPVDSFQTLGGFAERYVTYFEDFDFTVRAKRQGISTYVLPDPDLDVRHKVSRSFSGASPWPRHYRMLSSTLIFIRSHFSGPRKVACLGLSAAHVAATMVRSLPQLPQPRLLWRAVVRGMSD